LYACKYFDMVYDKETHMKPKQLIDHFIAPSTRRFWQEGRQMTGYSLFDFIHGYVYGRWPYLYIGIGTGEHRLAGLVRPLINLLARISAILNPRARDEAPGAAFADTYHGKVVPLDVAHQLISIREPLHLPDLEQVIPYKQARAIILQNPDHIVALDCPCRVARENPCLPLDVCLVIGQPFADFILEHQPQHAKMITSEKAFDILQAEDARGHVHHAFFKDAMLGRFYAICNCCACCCGAMHAHQHGTPMLASSGYRAEIDPTNCIMCGNCIPYCQFGALSLHDSGLIVDAEKCMGCGICLGKCSQEAIHLVRDPAKGQPLEINRLMDQAVLH
jgi:Pyruvate/2-oxoacid:ferredoxin oxidoreductase delta subunit